MAEEMTAEERSLALGLHLRTIRIDRGMSLREVQDASGDEISNAYLSQLETGKIKRPSPHVLFTLSGVLKISYEDLMSRAGYISTPAPAAALSDNGKMKHGSAATLAEVNLTKEEEKALLSFLNDYLRKKK